MAMKNNIYNLKIAGLDIPVNYVASFDDSRVGEYDSERREINLLLRLQDDPKALMTTLVHELVHCVLDVSGANYGMSEKTEEQVVMAVEALAVPAVRLLDQQALLREGIYGGRGDTLSES